MVTHLRPCFSDHELVMVHLCFVKPPPRFSMSRDLSNYSKEILCYQLAQVDWNNEATDVQEVWNDFETKLITIVDRVAPMSKFKINSLFSSPSKFIKRKKI